MLLEFDSLGFEERVDLIKKPRENCLINRRIKIDQKKTGFTFTEDNGALSKGNNAGMGGSLLGAIGGQNNAAGFGNIAEIV